MADRVILGNHLWLNKYTARSAPIHKCCAIVNHVDERVFRSVARQRTSTEPRIVFPGGLQWHQGLDIALKAFAVVRAMLPDARFDIYGDGNMKPQLIALAAELGLDDSVCFHEPVPLHEVVQIMADADLAYSTKIMEFMSVGVPVVVSATKVDNHYFSDDVVRFFPSGDHDALAAAMLELLRDTSLREAQIQRAREYVSRHGWSRHKQTYFDLVDGLLPAGKAAVVALHR
jgi:glycosyltransferase involved in cell wall biosynthesis